MKDSAKEYERLVDEYVNAAPEIKAALKKTIRTAEGRFGILAVARRNGYEG